MQQDPALPSPFRPYLVLGCLFVFVLLSRLPFLDAGYGVNIDAWRVARAARTIALSHRYEASRLPGYPVQEFICAALWGGKSELVEWKAGPVVLNGASALMGAAAVILFALVARGSGCKNYLLAARRAGVHATVLR